MGKFVRTNHQANSAVHIAPTLAVQVDDVIAKITSGTYSGQYGGRDTTANDGRQTVANVVGVSLDQTPAVDATGYTERVRPAQDQRICTVVVHSAICDPNNGFIYGASGARTAISAEASTPTQAQLAAMGFGFLVNG